MSIQSTQSQPTFMVGSQVVAHQFSQLIISEGSGALVEKDPLVKEGGELVFGRDSRVIGLNKVHLLPYPIKDPLLEGRFKALLPSSGDRFVENTIRVCFGQGFTQENAKAASLYAKNHHLPHREMRSCIEGGNSFVFFDPDDLPKAIVGILSVALTVIGLEEQDYFKTHSELLQTFTRTIKVPADDSVRAARNMSLYTKKREWDERFAAFSAQRKELGPAGWPLQSALMDELRMSWGSEIGYRQRLTAPIKEEDRLRYFTEACVWEAKIHLACQVIADDLHVPIKNIAFVPQMRFHIDMEMFVDPNGKKVYVDKASYQSPVVKSLTSIGCTAVPLPGVHEVSNDAINFMNGVFVSTSSGPLFVTNGVRRRNFSLLTGFERALLSTNPSFRIGFLDETMQEILTRNFGGIHCLTWEKPNYSTPVDIILSYTADEPVSEKQLRKQVSSVLKI